ncbi:MAG: ABC transporter permease subunit [Clostridiales bacterium]|nr:ABC transporter permease subunit [Clostridiales bacterium]
MKRKFEKIWNDRYAALIALPGFLYLLIFSYIPMAGVVTAFQNFSFRKPFLGNEWVGFKWFRKFFNGIYFGRTVTNTLIISVEGLIIGVVTATLFALLLNEIRDGKFKRITQSISYFPHFISTVVIVGLMGRLLDKDSGLINLLIARLGGTKIDFFNKARWFRTLYHGSGLWQGLGWSTIIYLGAITAIDPTLYEAATIDGASRFQCMRHITLPGIKPVVMTVVLMNIGSILNVGATKILLMYTPTTYVTADVISTYVYREGLGKAQYGYGAAIGLFNSIVNITLLLIANAASKRLTEVGLF